MYSYDTVNGADKGESNADFNFDLDVGVRSNYVIGRTRNMTQFVVRGQFDQASALDSASGATLNVNTYTLSHRTDIDINRNLTANINGSLTGRDLGTGKLYIQYRFGSGIESRRTNTNVDISTEGALTDDVPLWLPGSERMARAEIRQGLGRNLYVGVKGNQSFEDLNNHSMFLLFGGKF